MRIVEEESNPRLRSKLTNGEQVEPALEKPVNGRVLRVRDSDWDLVRE